MARIGRNDPCPCGSGKKYKNCCLNKDRARRIREGAWRQGEQATLDKLVAFAQRPSFNAQIIVAFNLFWNGSYGTEGLSALDRDEIGRFLDWYVYDYRLEQSRKRIIELFVEEMGSGLLPVEQERVRVWKDSYLCLYRIAGPAQQGLLPIVDALEGGEEVVWDSGLGRLGLSGDLVLGRVLRSSAPPHLSWAAILLSAAVESGLVAFVRKAYEQYRQIHVQASWPDVLSNSGYVLNHYLLKSAVKAGEARQAAGPYYDPFHTVERLREAEKRLHERAVRESAERLRAERSPMEEEGEPLRRTRGGILLPGHVQYKGSRELKP